MEIAFCEVYAFLQSPVNSEKALPLIHLFRRIDKRSFFYFGKPNEKKHFTKNEVFH